MVAHVTCADGFFFSAFARLLVSCHLVLACHTPLRFFVRRFYRFTCAVTFYPPLSDILVELLQTD
jgi:hypothetical protein